MKGKLYTIESHCPCGCGHDIDTFDNKADAMQFLKDQNDN